MSDTIDSIKLFKFNILPSSSAQKTGQQHIFLRLGSGGCCGWGECRIPLARGGVESYSIASVLDGMFGMTVNEGIRFVRSCLGQWRYGVSEMTELALLDLHGHLTGRSALELLVLNDYMPVMTTCAIPSANLDNIKHRIESILASGGHSAKIRLTGVPEYDLERITDIRESFGRERLYLIGAAGGGFTEIANESVEKLGVQLLKMYTAGLDSCEDPADIGITEWKQLQEFVDPLPLIAGLPVRPAREALSRVPHDTAKIYLIRPGVVGSVFDAVAFAEKMKKHGCSVVVGDDGFIGPGCSQWQQIAVGMGAEWVESIEKNGRSDEYLNCLNYNPVVMSEGSCSVVSGKGGFGLDIDSRMLELYASQVLDL